MEKLIAELKEAQEDYEKARHAESIARSRRTEALNKLNQAQREIDKAVEDLKKMAPGESDWRRAERTGMGTSPVINRAA